jgi:hypothetical protein
MQKCSPEVEKHDQGNIKQKLEGTLFELLPLVSII